MFLHYLAKTKKHGNYVFHLNVVCCSANRHTKHIKNITCGHRYKQYKDYRAQSIQPSAMYTVSIRHVCLGTVRHVNYGSSLRRTWKVNVTVNKIFYHSVLTASVLTAVKHVANDSLILQQDSALAHYTCNTVQLLENKTFNFTSFDYFFPPNNTEVNHIDYKI